LLNIAASANSPTVLFFFLDLLFLNERKAAARKYPTCLDIYGCRELGLSEAKGKFTFALKRELFLYFLLDKKVNKESRL
jgi:hypothetical protein